MATLASDTINTVRFNRAQYSREWIRQHHLYERQQYRSFKAALDEQTNTVLQYVKSHGTRDLNNHLSVLITRQPIQNAYERCYIQVGSAHARWTYDKIQALGKGNSKSYSGMETKDGPGFFSAYWSKLMSLFFHTQAAERVTGVTDTTKDNIRQLLSDSSDMTLSEQATYIEDQLSDPDFNRMRALRIARTESTTAANYGALLGAESSDYEVGKIWIPVMDMNTRPDHAEMDGQPPILIDEEFEVGTYYMKYPGDMSAPAKEVINCRCSIAIVPLLGANGVPVLKVA